MNEICVCGVCLGLMIITTSSFPSAREFLILSKYQLVFGNHEFLLVPNRLMDCLGSVIELTIES